jgi:predicted transcriptional regulator
MQLIERVNDKLLKESMSVLKMSKETGIPSYRIYKWIDGKGNPKTEDAAILEQWLNGNLDIVPKRKAQYDIINANDPAYLAGQLAMAERLIAKLEESHEEAKADKNKLFDALAETRQTINDLLKPMVASLKEIPPVLDTIVRNSNEHDKEIMKALDHLVGNAPGTLAKEAGKRILKGAMEQQKTGKVEVGKSGKQI